MYDVLCLSPPLSSNFPSKCVPLSYVTFYRSPLVAVVVLLYVEDLSSARQIYLDILEHLFKLLPHDDIVLKMLQSEKCLVNSTTSIHLSRLHTLSQTYKQQRVNSLKHQQMTSTIQSLNYIPAHVFDKLTAHQIRDHIYVCIKNIKYTVGLEYQHSTLTRTATTSKANKEQAHSHRH